MKKSELAAKRKSEALAVLREIRAQLMQVERLQGRFNRLVAGYDDLTDGDSQDLALDSHLEMMRDELHSWFEEWV